MHPFRQHQSVQASSCRAACSTARRVSVSLPPCWISIAPQFCSQAPDAPDSYPFRALYPSPLRSAHAGHKPCFEARTVPSQQHSAPTPPHCRAIYQVGTALPPPPPQPPAWRPRSPLRWRRGLVEACSAENRRATCRRCEVYATRRMQSTTGADMLAQDWCLLLLT